MEDTTAVLEAPELEAEESETGSADSPENSEGESSQSTERPDTVQDEPAIIESDGKLKLSGKALETLNKLKSENPKQAREFRAALFDAATLRKEFPEGIKEAVSLKQELDEIGGMEAIGTMRGELDAWKGLDADWAGNKPQFASEMAESNPEAFAFHAPFVMSKFAEVAPEKFTHEVAKVIAADMGENDVVMTGRLLESVIFDESGQVRQGMEAVARNWAPIAKYIMRISSLAKTPPKQETKQQNGQPTNEIEQREKQLTVREFTAERDSIKNSITESEFRKNAGNRKLPPDKISTIKRLYEDELNRSVQSIPRHKEKVDRYVAAKDRTGYRKYMEGAIRGKAAAAMSSAFRQAGVGNKPGPKLVSKPTATTTTSTAPTGFVRVGSKPSFSTVNWEATGRIPGKKGGDGRFILRDGSKVLYER